ncbi:MAG: selenocysteine-specific translation elongation factor [Eubacteriales bacterium]|nr:selenocysteine-specific translation elongation factor [Eubacteriales bacterium]
MQNIIVGTAGHVDHGKTCLIKALSGYDTDRLKEEKKRGITIDLGFANLPNDAGLHIGIIDVPGHEKFVKNMLAGIGGIDLVLMVIALDEGVMPQTTEHFEILKMLHIKEGIIVLTKSDTVDDDWADMVEADVREMVKGSFLEKAPSIRVSAYTGENIEKLRSMIIDMVRETGKRREDAELFRLAVDRAFTMEGFGTVVTGTLQEGSVSVGQEIMMYPEERILKVRGIQSHGKQEETAYAGQRTAINLLNIKKEEITRGDVLAYPGSLVKSILIDVKLTLFKTTSRRLKSGDRVHLNYGASQVIAKVVMLDKDITEAGESCYAQLRFDEPVVMKKNDRFIIRFYSPVETFGGGIVLDAAPQKHKRHDEEVVNALTVKEKGDTAEVLELEIREQSRKFPDGQSIAAGMDMSRLQAEFYINHLKEKKKIIILSDGSMIHSAYWKLISDHAIEILKEYHKENPITDGMDKEEFKSRLLEKFHLPDLRKADVLLSELQKRMFVKTSGTYVSIKDFSTAYSDELENMRMQIMQIYAKAGIEAPPAAEITGTFKDKLRAKQIIENMHKEGLLVKISPTTYLDKKAFDGVMAKLRAYLEEHESITLGEFRDIADTSRKYAMQILEYLDRQKITKMVGEARVLL